MPLMTHPQHGADNVGAHEIGSREAQGWKVTTLKEWLGSKYRETVTVAAPVIIDLPAEQNPSLVRGKHGKRS